jgi:hypothetical protein
MRRLLSRRESEITYVNFMFLAEHRPFRKTRFSLSHKIYATKLCPKLCGLVSDRSGVLIFGFADRDIFSKIGVILIARQLGVFFTRSKMPDLLAPFLWRKL